MTSELVDHINTVCATIDMCAAQKAREKARILYTLSLVTYDPKRNEPKHDAAMAIALLDFPLNELAEKTFFFAQGPVMQDFQMSRDTAIFATLSISLVCQNSNVSTREFSFTSGPLESWDTRKLRIVNSHATQLGELDWTVDLDYANGQLVSIGMTHNPAHCASVVALLTREAEAAASAHIIDCLMATRGNELLQPTVMRETLLASAIQTHLPDSWRGKRKPTTEEEAKVRYTEKKQRLKQEFIAEMALISGQKSQNPT